MKTIAEKNVALIKKFIEDAEDIIYIDDVGMENDHGWTKDEENVTRMYFDLNGDYNSRIFMDFDGLDKKELTYRDVIMTVCDRLIDWNADDEFDELMYECGSELARQGSVSSMLDSMREDQAVFTEVENDLAKLAFVAE